MLDLLPETAASLIIGGPEDTFFIVVDGEYRQGWPDGRHEVWGDIAPGGLPLCYTKSGRTLGLSDGGTAVAEFFPDGSSDTLLTGLQSAYDLVASDADTIFVSDITAGTLIRLNPDGTSSILATIAPDNTDLALDPGGDLYVNSAASGFARVDLLTGQFTQMTAPNAECAVLRSPAEVVFDPSGRAVFASWVDNMITWVDLGAGEGGNAIHQPWANSNAADVGPDDALYVAVNGCGSSVPSQVVRFTAEGLNELYLDGLVGHVHGLAFDSSGGLYASLATQTTSGVYYLAQGTTTLTLVPDSANLEIGSLAVEPTTGHVFGYRGKAQEDPALALVTEFSTEGMVDAHEVQLPRAPLDVLLDFAPDGTLYAFATEEARFMTGPEVDRWILALDLAQGTSQIVAQVNRVGCCPMGSFSVDDSGTIWWLLNPDFLLYQVHPAGQVELFASNLPVDAGYVNRNSTGDIFLNSPEGLYRLWIPAIQARVYLPLVLHSE
ncbi:MAG: hypothetical protein PVH41_17140 [Anaerolineae bacterium]